MNEVHNAAAAASSWNVVLVLGVLCSLALNAVMLFNANRPQKRDVTIDPGLVTKQIFDLHVMHTEQRDAHLQDQIDTIRSELRDISSDMRSKLTEEIGKVHDRINELLLAVGQLQGPKK